MVKLGAGVTPGPSITEAKVSIGQNLTFNPENRKNGVPEGIPAEPIGTKDEAEALGLEPIHYSTCSRPVSGVNRGCKFFASCPMSYKGKTLEEGGGPRIHAYEVVQPGQPIRRWEDTCFAMVVRISDIEDNGGAVRIIADEGDTYEKVEGIYIKTFVDEDGNTVKVPAADGEQHYPNVARGDMLVEKTVPAYKRAAENQTIATDIITAQVIAKEQERLRGQAFPAALGLEVGSTPLDKRNRRGGKRKDESA